MIAKFKEYLEYRKNKKIAKMELTKIVAATLPVVMEISNKGTDIAKFIIKLTNDTKNIKGDKLIEMVLKEVSTVLQADSGRIIEILSYLFTLSAKDMQKILIHSIVETTKVHDTK